MCTKWNQSVYGHSNVFSIIRILQHVANYVSFKHCMIYLWLIKSFKTLTVSFVIINFVKASRIHIVCTVWFKINWTTWYFLNVIFLTHGITYSYSINIFLNPNCVVSNWWKGQWNYHSSKEMATVFINIAKNGFTHMKTHSNIEILCYIFMRLWAIILVAIFFLYTATMSFFFLFFNAIFTISIWYQCVLYELCENNFRMA